MSIASGDVPRIVHARRFEPARQLERRLSAELHDHAHRLLALDDLEHVLERQRLEVQLVGDVEVGRDRLGVRVDHDRLVPLLAQRQRGAHAAVVELDALPDAVRPAAEDDDRLAGRSAAPRSPRRSCCRGTASPTETRRRRCRPSCTPGGRRAPSGARAPSASVSPRSVAELAVGEAQALHRAASSAASTSASAAIPRSASSSSCICARNHGSIAVSS